MQQQCNENLNDITELPEEMPALKAGIILLKYRSKYSDNDFQKIITKLGISAEDAFSFMAVTMKWTEAEYDRKHS